VGHRRDGVPIGARAALACEHTCTSTGLAPDPIWLTAFCFDAASHLRPGETNTVAVRFPNRLGVGGIRLPVYPVSADRELDAELIGALLAKSQT
jgi:hypothetical protein